MKEEGIIRVRSGWADARGCTIPVVLSTSWLLTYATAAGATGASRPVDLTLPHLRGRWLKPTPRPRPPEGSDCSIVSSLPGLSMYLSNHMPVHYSGATGCLRTLISTDSRRRRDFNRVGLREQTWPRQPQADCMDNDGRRPRTCNFKGS